MEEEGGEAGGPSVPVLEIIVVGLGSGRRV